MLDYMTMPFKRYAEFTGRSRRMEYWSFALLNFIVYIVLGGLMFAGGFSALMMADPAAMSAPPELGGLFYVGAGLLGLYGLAVLIPSIAVAIRRLHDRDMSGWWLLGFIVGSMIPFVGFVASIAMLVIMLLPGTPGPNRFGPDPKDPANTEAFS